MFSHLLAKFQYAGIDRAVHHFGCDGTVVDPASHVLRGISFLYRAWVSVSNRLVS